jgi:hypothetical protein
VELGAPERFGMLRTEQVGASHRVDHQRAATEERKRDAVAGFHEIRQMIRRVSRSRDRFEDKRPDLDAVAARDSSMWDLDVAGRGREELRAACDELGAAGDEIGV